jgi:hypothetical protein
MRLVKRNELILLQTKLNIIAKKSADKQADAVKNTTTKSLTHKLEKAKSLLLYKGEL